MSDPGSHHPTLTLDGSSLSIAALRAYTNSWQTGQAPQVQLSPEAWERIDRAASLVAELAESGQPVYGVTTGLGDLAREYIPPQRSAELQHQTLRSHAAAWGEPFSAEIVRAGMLVRLNTWAKGHSGLRRRTVQLYLDLLNRGVVPVVYEKGSLGASGDLAPLAMLSLVLIGEGEAVVAQPTMTSGAALCGRDADGDHRGSPHQEDTPPRLPAAEALRQAGLAPIELTYKEALALINGTTLMAGEGALLLHATRQLYTQALAAYALCVEALCGRTAPFDARVHAARPQPGQSHVASELRRLLSGSGFVDRPDSRVQDGYSLRCIPQIAGPSFEVLANCERTLEVELNSASDNPLFWPEADAKAEAQYIGAGNFHGQNLAMAFDFLAVATAEIASLAERQVNRLVNAALSGLPAFLAAPGGTNSGLMIAHYAQASLVSECRTLCHPAVVDNIPTSADQEDHVNMGPVALRKYRTILANAQGVIAILLLCTAQAVDLRGSAAFQAAASDAGRMPALHPSLGNGTQPVYAALRAAVPFMEADRVLYPEIELLTGMVREGAFL